MGRREDSSRALLLCGLMVCKRAAPSHTSCFSVGVGIVIIALSVIGLGWRPSVVVTWLMKVALQIRNFILLTFTLT